MIRTIIEIDEEMCNGCGLCAKACREGAIGMVGGKAKLLREDYCDGLGNCLPVCPTGAIQFVERETKPFSYQEEKKKDSKTAAPAFSGCPGNQSKSISRESEPGESATRQASKSELSQWPVQIKLAPVNAPYFANADLLIAADCTAFSYGDFHSRFMKNKVTLIGCPKLDAGEYSEKLTEILKNNEIKTITIVRMEVPCCGGLEKAVQTAWNNSGKRIPWQRVILSLKGDITEVKEGDEAW